MPVHLALSNLEQLQQALQAHVLGGDDTIARAIDESPETSADVRLGVYSDAYRLRLIEALESNFPTLSKLMGEEAFARLTQEYLVNHPSRHFSIRWFGHTLAEFLGAFPDYCAQPWLAELAAWEWRIAAAFDASDANTLTESNLAAIAPDDWPRLRFTAHPSVQRIALVTSIVSIAKAASDDAPLPAPQIFAAGVEWLIWRQGLTVQYRSLDAAEAAAVDALIAGATFAEICEALTAHYDAEEVPLRAASLLKTWIADGCLSGCMSELAAD